MAAKKPTTSAEVRGRAVHEAVERACRCELRVRDGADIRDCRNRATRRVLLNDGKVAKYVCAYHARRRYANARTEAIG